MSMAAPNWRVVIVKRKVWSKCVSEVCGAPSSHSHGTFRKHEWHADLLDEMNMVNNTETYTCIWHVMLQSAILLITGALPIPRYSYSNNDDVIFANSIRCNGSERDLLNCDIFYNNGDSFDNDFLVGVRCDGMFPCPL